MNERFGFAVNQVTNCLLLATVLSSGLIACKKRGADTNGESKVKFAQGLGGASHGHEKLTELATKMTNEVLDAKLGNRPVGFRKVLPWNWGSGEGSMFFTEDQIEQPAYRNSHPLTWGSLSADFPPTTRGIKIAVLSAKPDRDSSADKISFLNYMLCKHYNFTNQSSSPEQATRPRLAECDKMATSGAFQDVHFLRNWQGTTNLATGKQTCEASQKRIRDATIRALSSWQTKHFDTEFSVDGDRYPRFVGMFFLGLGAHTVQDAFSGAHVDRDPNDPRQIRKICHYNGEVIEKNLHPNVCRHKVPFDTRDLIWRKDAVGHLKTTKFMTAVARGFLNRLGGEFDDLTDEGQGAVSATMGYFLTFTKILSELPAAGDGGLLFTASPDDLKIVDKELDEFFNFSGDVGDDPRKEGSGYLNCSRVVETI